MNSFQCYFLGLPGTRSLNMFFYNEWNYKRNLITSGQVGGNVRLKSFIAYIGIYEEMQITSTSCLKKVNSISIYKMSFLVNSITK